MFNKRLLRVISTAILLSAVTVMAIIPNIALAGGGGGGLKFQPSTPQKPLILPSSRKFIRGYEKGHFAIDLSDESQLDVRAAGAGEVIKASSGTYGGGYGNYIIIDHGHGLKSLYAHLDSVIVKDGDLVSSGQLIGTQGSSGRVLSDKTPQVHFEVIKNGLKVNPFDYLTWNK